MSTKDKHEEKKANATEKEKEKKETKNEKDREIEKLKKQLEEEKERYLRLYAEFDNYRKRVLREIEEIKEATKRSLINEFLVILDNMEKALSTSSDHKEAIIEGIELTMKSFKDILKKHGVKEINPEKEEFNPDLHDALMMQPTGDLPKNTVVQTLEKGYMYKDKLIRPAKVIVSAGQESDHDKNNNESQNNNKTNNEKED